MVNIAKLVLPGDFRERVDHPRITERLDSFQRFGILVEPMVRRSDWKVIYGRDRIAGAVRLGKTELMVKLVECTDAEAEELELIENVQRRHDTDEQRLGFERLVSTYEKQVRAELQAGTHQAVRGTGGRHKTARGLARERAAKALGIRAESVKRKEHRVKKALTEEKLTGERAPAPVIELIGMELTETFLRDVERSQRFIDQCAGHLQAALMSLNSIEQKGLTFPKARLQRIYDEVRAAASLVRANKPASLCPWCKGLPNVQEQCAACLAAGWISLEVTNNVPKDLWATGDRAVVAYRGRYEKVSDLLRDWQSEEPPAEKVLAEPIVEREEVIEEDVFA